jgi:hypothetical protein
MVLVDVNVGSRSCLLEVELAARSLAPLSCVSHQTPTIDPVLQAAQQGSEHGNITRPHSVLLVLTPAFGNIWAINTTVIDIPTAQSATMGDVGDEEELDLNNPPFPLTAIDREILATRDEDYHRTTWGDLKQIIGTATPSHVEQCKPFDLTRTPSKQRTRTTQTPPIRSP